MSRSWRIFRGVVVALAALLVAIQLVPWGRDHVNPRAVQEPAWDQPATRQLAVRACYDCHSNETRWPWYSNVAPISWLLQYDVREGRQDLNFSEWQRGYEEAGEAAKTVLEGEMPPRGYLLLHPQARLSPEEARALARGLAATVGPGGGGQGQGEGEERGH